MQPLLESEVIFSKGRVPDNELFACLLWEFFRESKIIRQLALDWRVFFKSGDPNQDQSALWRRMSEIKPTINHPLRIEEFAVMVVIQCFGLHERMDVPWQKLPSITKQKLIDGCQANPPVFVGYDLHAAAFQTAFSIKRRGEDAVMIKAAAMMPDKQPSKELVLLVVDWARYDNNAIKEGLASVFKELSRPIGMKPQVRKGSGLGNPNEWRGKLNDLGATRAFARHAASELKWQHPKIYKFFAAKLTDKGPTSVAKKLAAARRRFVTSFKRVLSFEKGTPVCLTSTRFSE